MIVDSKIKCTKYRVDQIKKLPEKDRHLVLKAFRSLLAANGERVSYTEFHRKLRPAVKVATTVVQRGTPRANIFSWVGTLVKDEQEDVKDWFFICHGPPENPFNH
jgi:hypothetical protein|tara:strand:- start:37 stop:351 length:315 start_codon:yes stop_codon:yes gene_type:complete